MSSRANKRLNEKVRAPSVQGENNSGWYTLWEQVIVATESLSCKCTFCLLLIKYCLFLFLEFVTILIRTDDPIVFRILMNLSEILYSTVPESLVRLRVPGSDNWSRTSRRVVRFHWFASVTWHICTNHSTPRRRPVKSYSFTWLLVTANKFHSKTFWRCNCCSLCFVNYGALPFSFPISSLLHISRGSENLFRWEIWRWVKV